MKEKKKIYYFVRQWITYGTWGQGLTVKEAIKCGFIKRTKPFTVIAYESEDGKFTIDEMGTFQTKGKLLFKVEI